MRLLDRWWGLLSLIVPPAGFLAVAAVLGISEPSRGEVLIALGFALAAMAYVVVLMAAAAIRGFLWLYRVVILARSTEVIELGVEQLLGNHWSVPLCHVTDPVLAEALPHAARDRTAQLDHRTPVRPEHRDVLCLERGVTNTAAREVLARVTGVRRLAPTSHVLVFTGDGSAKLAEPEAVPRRASRGIPLFLGAIAVVIAVNAQFIADWERAACRGAECRERPATYWDAVYWLLNRLSGGDPEGLGAVTAQGRSIGLLVTLMSLVVVTWVIGLSLQQSITRTQNLGRELVESFNESTPVPAAEATVDPPEGPASRPTRPSSHAGPVRRKIPAFTMFATGLTVGLLAGEVLRRSRIRRD